MRGNPGDVPKEPRRIVSSEGGREVFRAFHNESIRLRTGKFRDIEGELGRWRENAIRLALGQCVADDLNAAELSEAQAMRAVELARWCVLSALGIMNAGRHAARRKVRDAVLALLADSPKGIRAADIYRTRIVGNAKVAHSLLEAMEAEGELTGREEKPEGGGHVTRLYTQARK